MYNVRGIWILRMLILYFLLYMYNMYFRFGSKIEEQNGEKVIHQN